MPGVNVISKNNAWAPSSFPVAGRLPRETLKVVENYEMQTEEEKRFRQMTNSDGRKQHSECCHSLHISLFFDGTNNNDDNDRKKNHPSNISKLFHASLRDKQAEARGYFSYYMPGVGTAFPEMSELKQQIAQDDLRQRIEQTSAMLRAAGSLFEPGRGLT